VDTSTTTRLVPIEDLETRRVLWHAMWDWIIGECERLATEKELRDAAAGEVPDDRDHLPNGRL